MNFKKNFLGRYLGTDKSKINLNVCFRHSQEENTNKKFLKLQ